MSHTRNTTFFINLIPMIVNDYSNSWVKPNVYKDFGKSDVDKIENSNVSNLFEPKGA
ncbi:hypothetical protein [Clostridium gasigenes]|uniref:hypothetical protein n=1 Tax=Clostridium gasigenes TaxID=94869 RepID=UPI001C0D69E6|nr:hypothetical protein [Clostridium gasigenes]MBU3106979.1 hypothetical protein [Clostridium gasigenes]